MKVERKDVKHQCLLNILLIKVAKMESIGSDVRRIIKRNNSQTLKSMEALNKMIRQISSNGWILRNFEILRFSQMSRFLVWHLRKKYFCFYVTMIDEKIFPGMINNKMKVKERKGDWKRIIYFCTFFLLYFLRELFFWVTKFKFDL